MNIRKLLCALLISGISAVPVFACCSLAPARFSQTKGLAAEIMKDGHMVHLLGYQNNVQNGGEEGDGPQIKILQAYGAKPNASKNKAQPKNEGNAMFLPIPAAPGSMSQANIVDTSTCPHALEDMEK